MDIFFEEMVKKEKSKNETLLSVLIVFAAVLIIGFLFFVVLPLAKLFSSIIVLLMVGVGYGAYILISFRNQEFEYTLVNSALDVDKILNKKIRRRVASVNLYELEAFGTLKNPEYEGYKNNSMVKKIDASTSAEDEATIYFVYNAKSVKTLLLFTPSERIVNIVKKLYPKKEFI